MTDFRHRLWASSFAQSPPWHLPGLHFERRERKPLPRIGPFVDHDVATPVVDAAQRELTRRVAGRGHAGPVPRLLRQPRRTAVATPPGYELAAGAVFQALELTKRKAETRASARECVPGAAARDEWRERAARTRGPHWPKPAAGLRPCWFSIWKRSGFAGFVDEAGAEEPRGAKGFASNCAVCCI